MDEAAAPVAKAMTEAEGGSRKQAQAVVEATVGLRSTRGEGPGWSTVLILLNQVRRGRASPPSPSTAPAWDYTPGSRTCWRRRLGSTRKRQAARTTSWSSSMTA